MWLRDEGRRLSCRAGGKSRLRLRCAFLSFLGVGKPEVTIAVEHKSQRDEQQSQSGDHHATLLRLLGVPRLRPSRQVTIGPGNERLQFNHASTGGAPQILRIVCLENRRKTSGREGSANSDGPEGRMESS